MANMATAPAGPDRPRRALLILADAGEAGLTTPEIVAAAGETGRKGALTWYGGILRDAERAGWVIRLGRSAGGYRRGPAVIWAVTEAGRERLAQYDRARSVPTTRQAAAWQRTRKAAGKQEREMVLAAARMLDLSQLTSEQSLVLVRELRAQGCLLQEIGRLFGRSREYIRLALKYDAWPVTSAMIIRNAPRMDQVIERWQELGT